LGQINFARGEVQATTMGAEATAEALRQVGQAIDMDQSEGRDAVALNVPEKWSRPSPKYAVPFLSPVYSFPPEYTECRGSDDDRRNEAGLGI
jgi:hypothetical protein